MTLGQKYFDEEERLREAARPRHEAKLAQRKRLIYTNYGWAVAGRFRAIYGLAPNYYWTQKRYYDNKLVRLR